MPSKIKFNNVIYKYDKERKDYIHEISYRHSETLLYNVMDCHLIKEILETKVELIENEIDIQAIEELKILDKDVKFFSPIIVDNRIKINEIIKAIKQLNNKISNLQSN